MNQQEDSEEEAFDTIEETRSKTKRTFMPHQYNKAKRTLNKLIFQYFTELKSQYLSKGGKIVIDDNELQTLINTLYHYVGLRHNKKPLKYNVLISKRNQTKKQYRNGAFAYISQGKKLLNCTIDGKIQNIPIQSSVKLPQIATPVPFNSSIYLLDGVQFNQNTNTYIPLKQSYKINDKNHLQILKKNPILQRTKCGIIKMSNYIYLIGGYVGPHKVLTQRCERYQPQSGQSQEISQLNMPHECPTACVLKNIIWVFSRVGIQYFDGGCWRVVNTPFAGLFYPFQFCYAINDTQIMMFGGTCWNRKLAKVGVYSTLDNLYEDYGDILPQQICNERTWGPCLVGDHLIALSNMQASVYPQVGYKSNSTLVMHIGSSNIYLSSIAI